MDQVGVGEGQPAGPLARLSFVHEALNVLTAFLWLLAYSALLRKLRKERSARGLSLQSLFALVFTEASNLVILAIIHVSYGVRSSAVLFLCDIANTLLAGATFVSVSQRFKSSYEEERDTFGLQFCLCARRGGGESTGRSGQQASRAAILSMPRLFGVRLHWLVLYVLAGGIALLIQLLRQHHNLSFALGYWECYTDAVMALALVPQLFQFYNKRPRKVPELLGRFVVFMLLARITTLAYWISDPWFTGLYFPGRGVHLLSETVNILILLDFAYYYVCAKRRGAQEINLPL